MPNRLETESSPYLLQHRDNPVDWYPWGEEALERARREDRPILLSIGYSACHWCHVMERESFEDPGVAEVMNRSFVNVKVDREERPDLDSVYMTAVQSMTGQGGWPLTVFLTPEGVPFYGGTYFPPEPRQGMPSFRQVLDATASAYQDRRDEVQDAGEKLVDALERATTAPPDAGVPGQELLNRAVRMAQSRFDARNGGFGGAPKFPQAPTLDFLLRRGKAGGAVTSPPAEPIAAVDEDAEGVAEDGGAARGEGVEDGAMEGHRVEDRAARDGVEDGAMEGHRVENRAAETDVAEGGVAVEMVTKTLDAMARGGIRDHLAGGFHRYTVDAGWLVPHFEKMLYDNGLLARLYLHHHLLTGDPGSRAVAVQTLDYLLSDMRSEEGGFYSARDADSEGEEGRFYVWSAEEVDDVLVPAVGADDAALFRRTYDVSPQGNWEGKTILRLPRSLDTVAEEEGLSREGLEGKLTAAREALLARRREREPPLRDEKILVGWNGLALRALAEAGPALDRPDYTKAARKGAAFVLDRMREDGRLLHAWKDGRARVPGFLEDHASLGNALLALHEATLEPRWLEEALWCCRQVMERFWDGEQELFFDTPVDGEELVVRPRDAMDNPSPSGTSLAVELLLRGGVVFADPELRRVAERALARDVATVRRHPSAFGALLGCLDFHLSPTVEVAVVGARDAEATARILHRVHGRYLPDRVVVGREEGEALSGKEPGRASGGGAGEIPLLKGRGTRDGRTTVYVCRNYACEAPVTDPDDVERLLDQAAAG